MTTACPTSNPSKAWPSPARVWGYLAGGVLVVSLVPLGFATCHGSPNAPVPVASAKTSAPELSPAAPPVFPAAPPQDSGAPPPGPWDQPAPTCVTDLIKRHVEKVGPGVAEVGCDNKHYRCVATLVRGQVAFNCAEIHLEDEKPATAAGELSL